MNTKKRKGLLLVAAAVALVALSASAAFAKTSDDNSLSGAGSSLVNPLVQQWIGPIGAAYGYSLTYASVGSGTGITDITARTVDFGASDAPLNPSQASACNGCIEIPWALSATTLSYNVPGAPNNLRLDGPTIAGIFLGTITKWNDPAITKLNPKVNLPDLAITPVHRSDGSGDTYAFTDYLQRVSSTFQSKVGNATLVAWPGGIGASGNAGISGVLANTSGAIGYISAAYALTNHLKVAAIKNNAGVFATPGLKGIEAAAALFPKVPSNEEMHIVNPPKPPPVAKNASKKAKAANKALTLAYPVSTFTYVIVPEVTPKATQLKKFIYWGITQGQKFGPKLIFAPLPLPILAANYKAIKTISAQ